MNADAIDDGGYDLHFVDDLQESFKCIVCHLTLRKPVQIIECGHRFCHNCFKKIRKYSEDRNDILCCPFDRLEIDPTKVFRDKGIERSILNLNVKCPNFEKGCAWEKELSNVQNHLRIDCEYELVKCSVKRCCKLVQRCEIKEHEKDCSNKEQKLTYEELESVVQLLAQRLQTCETQMAELHGRLGMYEEVLSRSNERLEKLERVHTANTVTTGIGIKNLMPIPPRFPTVYQPRPVLRPAYNHSQNCFVMPSYRQTVAPGYCVAGEQNPQMQRVVGSNQPMFMMQSPGQAPIMNTLPYYRPSGLVMQGAPQVLPIPSSTQTASIDTTTGTSVIP